MQTDKSTALDPLEIATITFPLIHELLRDAWLLLENEEIQKGNTIIRKRRSVTSILYELGNYAPRYYRMSVPSFWKLHELLKMHIDNAAYKHVREQNTQKKIGPNGLIHSSSRLSIALRYFAGGDPLDIALVHGVSHSSVFPSVWFVTDAINKVFSINYPTDYMAQEAIASGFKAKSRANFDSCAGAIDCMLIWTHRPSLADCLEALVDVKKFYCGRKKKFGLVLQAICDSKRRFLDINIGQAASTSDYLVFITSDIYYDLETPGFLRPGLAIFGDAAYCSNPHMVTPFRQASRGSRDAFNFYQSQLRINIECAFGMLTKRFGLLRKAMPLGISLKKTSAISMALCKLHNFCIDEKETIPNVAAQDACSLSLSGVAPYDDEQYSRNLRRQRLPVRATDNIPTQLIGGGHHSQDMDSNSRCQNARTAANNFHIGEAQQPRALLHNKVIQQDLSRPKPKGW